MKHMDAKILAELEQISAKITVLPGEEGLGMPFSGIEELSETTFGVAGCGQAQHLALDHQFIGTQKRFYVFAGGSWHYQNISTTDEAGLVQVAYASDRVAVCWDTGGLLKMVRCFRDF